MRLEPLAARERQQLIGQLGAALGGRAHVAEPLRELAVDAGSREPLFEEADVAEHDGEQIVEVVRHAGGELADRLEPLHLAQRRLDALALLDLSKQLAIGGASSAVRSCTRDFELLVEAPAFVLAAAAAQSWSAPR